MGCNTLPVQLTHPLVTVHILLLDLVVTLAKCLLVLVFSLEDALTQGHLLSWQPSLRAFPWWSFVMSFPYWPQHILHFSQVGKPILDTISDDSDMPPDTPRPHASPYWQLTLPQFTILESNPTNLMTTHKSRLLHSLLVVFKGPLGHSADLWWPGDWSPCHADFTRHHQHRGPQMEVMTVAWPISC